MQTKKTLLSLYSFPGFRAQSILMGIAEDPEARVITLKRYQKKTICPSCGKISSTFYDSKIKRVRDLSSGGTRIYLEFEQRRFYCQGCGSVKTETLSWLASSARFTERFEREIGRQCREMSVARVAAMNRLSWDQVRRMEMAYLKRLVDQHPPSKNVRAIGIDEVSVKKGHTYAIVVADLDERRPVWMGFGGRKEEHLNAFFTEIGPETSQKIQIAVMDMWKPFRNSTLRNAPQTRIIYDKFHVLSRPCAGPFPTAPYE